MDLPGNMSPTRREDVVSARNSCQRYSAVVANADVDLVVCWTSLIPDAVPPVKSKPFVVPFAAIFVPFVAFVAVNNAKAKDAVPPVVAVGVPFTTVFVPFVAVWVVHNAKAKNAVPPVFVVPFAAIFIFVCGVAVVVPFVAAVVVFFVSSVVVPFVAVRVYEKCKKHIGCNFNYR